MSDTAEKAYHAWPDRIAVVDIDGKLAYYCGQGPWGFDPKTTKVAIDDLLANEGKWNGTKYPIKARTMRRPTSRKKKPVAGSR
jgi:hypothetical protein